MVNAGMGMHEWNSCNQNFLIIITMIYTANKNKEIKSLTNIPLKYILKASLLRQVTT